MSQQQDPWNNLLHSWNANDAEIDKQAPSQLLLIDQINKHNRNDKRTAVFSAVVSITFVSYIIVEMYSGLPSIADTIFYSIALLLGLSCGLYLFLLVRRTNATSTDSSKTHIVVLLNRAKSNLKNLLFSRIVCIVALLMVLFVLSLIMYIALHKPLELKHYVVGGTALACCLLFIGVFIWLQKQRTPLEHQIAFLTKLENT